MSPSPGQTRQDLIRRELGAVALALSQQQRDTAQESMVQAGWLAGRPGRVKDDVTVVKDSLLGWPGIWEEL